MDCVVVSLGPFRLHNENSWPKVCAVGLVTVLVLPELLEPLTTRALPTELGHAIPISIPSILSAIARPTSAANFLAGICAAAIVVGLASAYGKRERLRVDAEFAREGTS